MQAVEQAAQVGDVHVVLLDAFWQHQLALARRGGGHDRACQNVPGYLVQGRGEAQDVPGRQGARRNDGGQRRAPAQGVGHRPQRIRAPHAAAAAQAAFPAPAAPGRCAAPPAQKWSRRAAPRPCAWRATAPKVDGSRLPRNRSLTRPAALASGTRQGLAGPSALPRQELARHPRRLPIMIHNGCRGCGISRCGGLRGSSRGRPPGAAQP